jgi:hypothetical protein
MEFACAASCRLSLLRVLRLTLPDFTAASPRVAKSSLGATLLSIPKQIFCKRVVLVQKYAITQLAKSRLAA